MTPVAPTRSLLLAAPLASAAVGAVLLALGSSGAPGEAAAEAALVAGSVCEAHELKARAEEDPTLQVEIPPEFDSPWPSREACLSHAAAEDPDAPGPIQPIQFSHKHHAGLYQIDCQYCHSGTDRAAAAGVPSVELCMGCHAQFPPSYDELEGIRTLKQHWADEEPIPWVWIHRVPDYVHFRHNRHIAQGIACQDCHGPVQEMDKVYMVPDTKWWPWGLPTQKLEMGWCIQCHRQNGVTQDCYSCHY